MGPTLGVKRLRRDVDHSHQSTAVVKNEWSYTSIPSTYLHGMNSSSMLETSYSSYISNTDKKHTCSGVELRTICTNMFLSLL